MSNRRKRSWKPIEVAPSSTSETFWNGRPTPARRCLVMVAVEQPEPGTMPEVERQHWPVMQPRQAVEVTYAGQTFYLDDQDGSAWRKVTAGHGAPQYAHRSVEPLRPITYLPPVSP